MKIKNKKLSELKCKTLFLTESMISRYLLLDWHYKILSGKAKAMLSVLNIFSHLLTSFLSNCDVLTFAGQSFNV